MSVVFYFTSLRGELTLVFTLIIISRNKCKVGAVESIMGKSGCTLKDLT